MAKLLSPFPVVVVGTIGDLTFYMMDGENHVRKKSRLTRKRVLKDPRFKLTRIYACLMAQASKIGSVIYQALPHYWRQGWMYRAFTGEAMQMLKEGKTVEEATIAMWERYVEAINLKGEDLSGRLEDAVYSAMKPPKGRRKKQDPRVKRLKPYSDLLAEASKMASIMYKSLPPEKRKYALYRAWVGEAMRFLQAQEEEESKSQFPMTKSPLGDLGAKVSEAQDSVEKSNRSKKSKKLAKKDRLFYIPPVHTLSPKRFARRRKHKSRLVGRSP